MEKLKKKTYRLKGHGSFVLRNGWIFKGLNAVDRDPFIFRKKLKKDEGDIFDNIPAADILGVGNNMASSIRYWMKACELMQESTARGAELTRLGRIIKEHDPYLNDIFTVWILHCYLVLNEREATSWFLFFNYCEAESYTREEIFKQMERELKKYIEDDDFSVKSLEDDVLAITNMYAKTQDDNPEETLVSPLARLGLLKQEGQCYTKAVPEISSLDERVVLYLLLKQIGNADSISIDTILNGKNGVGKVLNLGRVVLNQYLDKLEKHGYIRIIRTAGLDVVYNARNTTAIEVIEEYYNNEMN